ncbi:MAG: copper chaperone PCu(A)C [Thermodesulfovibrionales bacterium]
MRYGLIFLLILAISGCSQSHPDIHISDIVALPSPVMKGVVSVFMRISNNGGKDYLIGAKTDIKGSIVELHDVKNGRMVKVDRIKIPTKDKVEMVPRGLHIMIFNLPDNIMNGDEINLYMIFDKSGERAVKFKVLKKH